MRVSKQKRTSRTKSQVSTRVTPSVLMVQAKQWIFQYFWFLVTLILVLMGVYLRHVVLFPITAVRVYDPGLHIAQSSIINTVAPLVNNGFFGTGLDDIRDALQTLPWVDSVDVARQWPGRIVIHLSEKTPLAIWNKDDLITPDGVLFTPAADDTLPPLPSFFGPPAEIEAMVHYYQLFAHLLAPIQLNIQEMHLSERLSWDLTLSNGMIVKLGRDHMDQRLQRFVRVYPQVFAQADRKVAYVDLRYNHGMAVRWQDVG